MRVVIIVILLFLISCMPETYRCTDDCGESYQYRDNNINNFNYHNNINGIRVPYNYYGNNPNYYNGGGHNNFSFPSDRFNVPAARFHGWSQPLGGNSFNSNQFNLPAGRTHNWSNPGKWKF